ncbi:MAG: DUF4445 domain-containing protein [Gammaproteobacteria bacterium]|nr:DUF4445 domain-containing protein [Gammaproteobacteria bacterium]
MSTIGQHSVTITLTDDAAPLPVEAGVSVLGTARQNDIDIMATCGGRGRCRSCRIKLVRGTATDPGVADISQLSNDEIGEGYRLACQCYPQSDSRYSITPPTHETSFQILTETGEWQNLLDSIDPAGENVTSYGIAFDIGTTTVVGYLTNLETGATLACVSGLNPQTVFGGDLISRIGFAAEKKTHVKKLHQRIVTFMNDLSERACDQAGISRADISKVTLVGNTCMHHLFLSIDPTPLGSAPYDPVLREARQCPARECGLRLHEHAQVYTLPIIAGFVGADTVAMIMASQLDSRPGNTIAVDIGTNAEVVLKTDRGLNACSSPAGPALEGGQIRDGMRAAFGAIDRVSADRDIVISTIGDAPALGICGSGLIDVVAVLLDLGIISKTGRLLVESDRPLPDAIAARLRHDDNGSPEFVLVRAEDSGNHLDIVLSQGDIRQLQLAKAAIMSGVQTLLQQGNLERSDIDAFLLAGGFGNYINIRNARRIGLLPDLANDRIHFIANAAGLGAQMALLSDQCRRQAEKIAVETQHLSLAGLPGFQKTYLDAMGFPVEIRL